MADPKNKWSQPLAPPAPMFFGEKERDLVKQVNDELAERVIGQTLAYYPISIEDSNFNDIYGEAIEKVSLPPVRVYAYVEVANEQSNERYGYEYETKLTVNFHRKRLTEDQNLFVRVGDFLQYGEEYYEIVRTYNDTRYYFGQVQHKFQISAECIRARTGSFRVMPSVDRSLDTTLLEDGSTQAPPRESLYPPVDADYLTLTRNTRLTNGRYLVAGSGITLTDGGRLGPLTIEADTVSDTLQTVTSRGNSTTSSVDFQSSVTASILRTTNDITALANISASLNVSASYYYGDGQYLTNVGAGSATGQGPAGALQFVTGSGGISGSAKVLYDYGNDVLTLNTGLIHNRTGVSSNYTASVTDYILAVTSVPLEIELDAASFAEGQVVMVKDETGTASGVNTIILNPSASQTVDGESSATIDSPYGSIFLYSNGTNWFIY